MESTILASSLLLCPPAWLYYVASRLATGYSEVQVGPFCLFITKNCNMVTRGQTPAHSRHGLSSQGEAGPAMGLSGVCTGQGPRLVAPTAWAKTCRPLLSKIPMGMLLSCRRLSHQTVPSHPRTLRGAPTQRPSPNSALHSSPQTPLVLSEPTFGRAGQPGHHPIDPLPFRVKTAEKPEATRNSKPLEAQKQCLGPSFPALGYNGRLPAPQPCLGLGVVSNSEPLRDLGQDKMPLETHPLTRGEGGAFSSPKFQILVYALKRVVTSGVPPARGSKYWGKKPRGQI